MDHLKFCFLLLFATTSLATGKVIEIGGQERRELNLSELTKNLNRTRTKAGFFEFEKLMQPLSNIQELKQRQEIIKVLLEENTFQKLDALITQFASQDALSIAEMGHLTKKPSLKVSLIGGVIPPAMVVMISRSSMTKPTSLSGWALTALTALPIFQLIRSQIETTYQQVHQADEHVLTAGQIFELAGKLHDFIENQPGFRETIFGKRILNLSDEIGKHSDLKSTVGQAHDRYMAKDSYLYILRTLIDYDHLRYVQPVIQEIIQTYAELDAYLSIARLYREQSGVFTFATYLDQDEPQFSFMALSNPLIANAVRNDFKLDAKTGARHWVITGPQASGKTTAMQSIAYATLLAQSITIVPAAQAELTPMTSVQTYFNHFDPSIGLQNIGPGERVLMFIDKPYAGIDQLISEPRVATFLTHISNTQGLSVILATHFEQPSKLEEISHGHIANYQPEIDSDLKPTFKILPGTASWWFNDVDKRNAYSRRAIFGQL